MLHLLIVEGNTADIRAKHVETGGEIAHRLYARALEHTGIAFTHDVIFAADADAALPPGSVLESYDGIVWTGSALNIYQGGFPVQRQLDLARACFASGVPQFGSCWGLQVAVAAAGGDVIKNPKGREIGIARDIRLTPAGRAHSMYVGKGDVFDALAVHKDTIAILPPGAEILASNAISDVQAASFFVERGEFWGVQYHPEYHFGEVAACMRRYRDALVAEGLFANADELLKLSSCYEALDRGARPTTFGLDALGDDVRDPAHRMTELRNWLAHLSTRAG